MKKAMCVTVIIWIIVIASSLKMVDDYRYTVMENMIIDEGDHYTHTLWGSRLYGSEKGDEFEISYSTNKPIDVYILVWPNICFDPIFGNESLCYPNNFTAMHSILNTIKGVFVWTQPDDNYVYEVIFDNAVNSINNSANPQGDVRISFQTIDLFIHDFSYVSIFAMTVTLICFTISGFAILRYYRRKKRKMKD